MTRDFTQELSLTTSERCLLQQWSHADPRSGAGLRASIVLLAAKGMSRSEIARRLNVTRPTVIAWIRRFHQEGVAGLHDRARPGRRRTLRDTEVVLRTLTTHPDNCPYRIWSSRTLAAELGVSNGTIARIWRRWRLRPAVLPEFLLPTSPALSIGATDVVGFYADGHRSMLALRVGERCTGTHVPPYGIRHAAPEALQLCEALLAQNPPLNRARADTGEAAVRFLGELSARYPRARLHVLAGECSVADHPALRRWIDTDRLLLHLPTAQGPAWAELAVVAISAAVYRRTRALPREFSAMLLEAVTDVQQVAHDHRSAFGWLWQPYQSPPTPVMPARRGADMTTGSYRNLDSSRALVDLRR